MVDSGNVGMMQPQSAGARANAAKPVAMRAPVFNFKPEREAFLEETFSAVARLPD